jgi:hypothetical protein
MKPLVIILCLLIAGCATTADIRQSQPVNILDSDISPKKIANCIVYEGQVDASSLNRHWDSPQLLEINDAYKILFTFTGGMFITSSSPLAEITIVPQNTGSKIELRTNGMPEFAKDRIWHLVVKCASPTP